MLPHFNSFTLAVQKPGAGGGGGAAILVLFFIWAFALPATASVITTADAAAIIAPLEKKVLVMDDPQYGRGRPILVPSRAGKVAEIVSPAKIRPVLLSCRLRQSPLYHASIQAPFV